ncbi:MAG: hypothetical protein JXQ99_27600 [Hyphomicrobiaceae bacterium]
MKIINRSLSVVSVRLALLLALATFFSLESHSPLSVRPAIADGGGSDANEALEANFKKKSVKRKRGRGTRRATKRRKKTTTERRTTSGRKTGRRTYSSKRKKRSTPSNRSRRVVSKPKTVKRPRRPIVHNDKYARDAIKKADDARNVARKAHDDLMTETGGKTASTAIRDLKTGINEARWRYDMIEEQLERVERRKAGLIQQKKDIDDKSIFTPSDVAKKGVTKYGTGKARQYLDKKATQRAIQKATEEAAKRELAKGGLKSVASRIVGLASLLGDLVKYGGKKLIKIDVSNTLEEYIQQNGITATQLIRLQIQLQTAINRDNRTIERIQKLKVVSDKRFDEYLVVDKDAKKASGPQSKGADVRRATDESGDGIEKKLYEEGRQRAREKAKKSARIEEAPQRSHKRRTKKHGKQSKRRSRASRYHDSHFKGRRKQRRRHRRSRTTTHNRRSTPSSSGFSIGVSVGGVSISF